MHLHDRLTPRQILIDPPVSNRKELFLLFGEVLHSRGLVVEPEPVVRLLEEREAILSTAIGGGVAIPHAQIPGLGQLAMAFSVHPSGVDFPALDDEPVRLVFCLIGDSSTAGEHLAGLAGLAQLARRTPVLKRLVETQSGAEFLRVLREVELS